MGSAGLAWIRFLQDKHSQIAWRGGFGAGRWFRPINPSIIGSMDDQIEADALVALRLYGVETPENGVERDTRLNNVIV